MSSALATPSSTIRAASFMASAWIRGTMKPGEAAHTTGTLPMPSSKDRKSTRLNSSHQIISHAVFCLKKKNYHPAAQRALPAVIMGLAGEGGEMNGQRLALPRCIERVHPLCGIEARLWTDLLKTVG